MQAHIFEPWVQYIARAKYFKNLNTVVKKCVDKVTML